MPQAPDPLAPLRAAAAARAAAGLRRGLHPRGPGHAGLTDLASNDYLGLATHPEVIEAAIEAAREWGTGSTGSRLVTGSTALHAALEQALAAFAGAQSALVFSCGYLANLTAVTALAAALRPPAAQAGPGAATLIVSDEANHASLVDACRLARARVEITGHQDVAAVERALRQRREPAALVVTESAFSLGGDLAPLPALHRVTRAHGALLLVDEAHALGVVGPGGRGAVWEAGLAAEPGVVRTVTLSKALGAQGGAVLGASEVTGTLAETGRGFIFDTALAPPSAGAALGALRVLAARPHLATQARQNARRLADLATGYGLAVTEPAAAVLTVGIGDPGLAVAAQRICADHGVLAGCFRPPSVPPGGSCLRLTARADLTESDFEAADRALAAVRDHVRTVSAAGRK
ncbi:MAG TPA: 8-amino-7-oxononanoate synthase [Streptosporangiaceae bacterium]|nr:8-amino-7-oxononanoate synthase [Streptosporangiaceae bacterium]